MIWIAQQGYCNSLTLIKIYNELLHIIWVTFLYFSLILPVKLYNYSIQRGQTTEFLLLSISLYIISMSQERWRIILNITCLFIAGEKKNESLSKLSFFWIVLSTQISSIFLISTLVKEFQNWKTCTLEITLFLVG